MMDKLRELLVNVQDPLVILGFVGQAFFTGRFLVQWIASERRKQSVIPLTFWYFSVIGSTMLLVYSAIRADPVFVLAFMFNNIIYIRNLMLIRRQRRYLEESPGGGPAAGGSAV